MADDEQALEFSPMVQDMLENLDNEDYSSETETIEPQHRKDDENDSSIATKQRNSTNANVTTIDIPIIPERTTLGTADSIEVGSVSPTSITLLNNDSIKNEHSKNIIETKTTAKDDINDDDKKCSSINNIMNTTDSSAIDDINNGDGNRNNNTSTSTNIETKFQSVKQQFNEFEKDKAQVILGIYDTLLYKIFHHYDLNMSLYSKIVSFLTSNEVSIAYYVIFWLRIMFYGMLGERDGVLVTLFAFTYLLLQIGVLLVINYQFMLYNMTQFDAVYKCLNGVLYTFHYDLLANNDFSGLTKIFHVLFMTSSTIDIFIVSNATALNVDHRVKLFAIFSWIILVLYGYTQAYYLINLDYYSFNWIGFQKGWTGSLDDFEYNLWGSAISAQGVILSSGANLLVFFIKQLIQKIRNPHTVLFGTVYKVQFKIN